MSNNTSRNRPWWFPASQILNPRRLSYALITGLALWLAWLVSVSLGPGNMDLANQVVGTDYIQFHASGLTLRQGNSDLLYDFHYQSQLEFEIAGLGLVNFHANLTPPFFAWLFVPLSILPYVWSFIIWSIFGLIGLYASLKILRGKQSWRTYPWTLCWFPVFAVISFGQNSILALLVLSLTYMLWSKQRGYLAGLISSLILFKPQLIIGVAILWLVRYRKDWKALLGLLTGACTLGGLTFLFLPEAASSYFNLVTEFLPGMIYNEQFPLYHLHAMRGFWILLFPGMDWLAESISLILSVVGLGFFIRFIVTHHARLDLSYAAALLFTIFITPHAMIYDWTILLIPALLFWQETPLLKQYWKVVFAIIWLVTFLSGPLTFLQLQFSPVALQISVPVYLILLVDIARTLGRSAPQQDLEQSDSPA